MLDHPTPPSPFGPRIREVPILRRGVLPVVLGGGYGIDGGSTRLAWAAGVSVFFWLPLWRRMRRGLLKVLRSDAREQVTIMSGTPIRNRFVARAMLAWTTRALSTTYVDVWFDLWVKDERCFHPSHQNWVESQRSAGHIRAYGVSTHRRAIAERALAHPNVDVVMLRFNAAQRGIADLAEQNSRAEHPKLIIGYTATKWGYLVRSHPDGPPGISVPTASDCYALTLDTPGFDLVLAGPRDRRQLQDAFDFFLYSGPDWQVRRQALLHYGDFVAERYGRNGRYKSPVKFGVIPP